MLLGAVRTAHRRLVITACVYASSHCGEAVTSFPATFLRELHTCVISETKEVVLPLYKAHITYRIRAAERCWLHFG